MKVSTCSQRPILEPCGLENIDFQVDPYVGCQHHCYYCYALNQAESDWSREVKIHPDLTGQLAKELEGIEPQTIYLGYHTDPYQPCEVEQQQTRQVLGLLAERGFSASVLTKSDQVIRDIDLFKEMPEAAVSVSVAFADDGVRKRFEADTIDTGRRIAALAEIKESGIFTSALLCPVIPRITDVMPLIEQLTPVTQKIWVYGLSILNEEEVNWRNLKGIFETHYPDQAGEITEIIFDRDHAYWADMRGQLQALQDELEVDLDIHL